MRQMIFSFIIVLMGCLSVVSGQEARHADSNVSNRQEYIQKHKPLTGLKAVVDDGKVRLSFYRSSRWYPLEEDYNDLFGTIRIYRRKVDFIFGKNNKDFFDGLTCSNEDIIYKGDIKQPFIYNDDTVSIGQTYVYWVAAAKGGAIGPYPVKVRDPRIWWSVNKIAEQMYDLQKSYPELVKVTVLGKTHKGKEILGIEVGYSKKKVALIGSVHASESGAELIIPAIRSILEKNKEILDKVSIIAVPIVNLDERQLNVEGVPWYLRTNKASVDLNRNFPGNWEEVSYLYHGDSSDPDCSTYRGPSPASEPETQAVMAFIRKHRPSALFSFHHLSCVAGRGFLVSKASRKDEAYKQKYRKILDTYTQGYSDGYSDEDSIENVVTYTATPGSLPTWCYKEFGIPAFDVEWHKHPSLVKSLTDETDIELLERNQKQHSAALLNLLKLLRIAVSIW